MTTGSKRTWNSAGPTNRQTELEMELQIEKTAALYFAFNTSVSSDFYRKEHILRSLLPNRGKNTVIEAPFYTDFGYNCLIGDETFISPNVYLMDLSQIRIGKRCYIGPNSNIYTALVTGTSCPDTEAVYSAHPDGINGNSHPTGAVTIGENVWIGSNVTIYPGITIGKNCVIKDNSVVRENIPDNVVAAGSPCRVV